MSSFRFGEVAGGAIDSYSCKRVLFADEKLDVTLVELEGSPGDKYDVRPLEAKLPEDGRIWIVGQPGGHGETVIPRFRTLQTVTRDCRIQAAPHLQRTGIISEHGVFSLALDYGELFKNFRLITTMQESFAFPISCTIFPGNSGSPALNAQGRAIGIAHQRGRVVPISAVMERHAAELKAVGATLF